MDNNTWLVSSRGEIPARVAAFQRFLESSFEDKPVKWEAKIYKPKAGLSQQALFHVWVTDYAKHLLKKLKVSEEEMLAMKYTLQKHCYIETAWQFLITSNRDLFTGSCKAARRSTTKFLKGEMYDYMNWIQAKAADDGLILEAKGEYLDLKRGENA